MCSACRSSEKNVVHFGMYFKFELEFHLIFHAAFYWNRDGYLCNLAPRQLMVGGLRGYSQGVMPLEAAIFG